MPKILLEDSWDFKPNRDSIVTESTKSGALKITRIPGTLSVCDCLNGNKRKYPRAVWEKNLQEDSHLMQLIKRRATFGLLEHPADGKVDLTSPIAVLTTEARLLPDGTVTGELTILDTPEGNKLRALIEAGYNPTVSSRGFGSINNVNGEDIVQDDFICEGWDIVYTPSFSQAITTPVREESTGSFNDPQHYAENKTIAENISTPPVGPVQVNVEKRATTPNRKDTMNQLKEIRESVSSLKGMNLLSVSQANLLEGFNRITDLHRQIAVAQATDPSKSWDCQRLHEELNKIETSWNEAIEMPRREVARLSEDRKKLIAVAEATSKTATTYRTALTETVSKLNKRAKLIETVIKRGKGWKSVAVDAKNKLNESKHTITVRDAALEILAEKVKTLQADLAVKDEALNQLSEKYLTDTTKLAKKVLENRLGDKLTDELKNKLAECKRPNDVLAIQEAVLGTTKKEEKAPGAEAVVESKNNLTPSATKPAMVPVQEGLVVVQAEVRNPSSLSESVAIAQRLSKRITA